MASGYQALTEKEKATLRLLGDGHDAKSIAVHLGLSVHTINERLRDARGKMEMSSSRGAARRLREMERQTHYFHGDKTLGDAAATVGVTQVQTSAGLPRISRRVGLIVGGVFMSLSLALLTLSPMFGDAQAPVVPQIVTSPNAAAETAAVSAARQWLVLIDTGDWAGSWRATGEQFRSLNTSEQWAAASLSARAPLGEVVSRDLIIEEHVPAPPHGYQLVKFRTSYANRTEAIETLSLIWEAGAWKVVGITIE